MNLAFAWGIAACGLDWSRSRVVNEDSTPKPWPFPVPDNWPLQGQVAEFFRTWGVDSIAYEAVPRSQSTPTEYHDRVGAEGMGTFEYGVPFRSFGSWYLMWADGTSPTGGRLVLHGAIWSGKVPAERALPYHPLWPGFALNTLFYAGLAFGLSRGIRSIRRWRRSKRGRCRWCGYDLAGLATGSPYPECGSIPPTPSPTIWTPV